MQFLGAAAVALIYAPMAGQRLADFLLLTGTEWQAAVLALLLVLAGLALLLLLSACWASRRPLWRRLDLLNSAVSLLLYLLCTGLEAYFAACYPPNGPRINLVCYRTEWMLATVRGGAAAAPAQAVCFFQTLLYSADLLMAVRAGVSLL